jgi:hypothetical protein
MFLFALFASPNPVFKSELLVYRTTGTYLCAWMKPVKQQYVLPCQRALSAFSGTLKSKSAIRR